MRLYRVLITILLINVSSLMWQEQTPQNKVEINPVPIELIIGNNSSMYQMSFYKKIPSASAFAFTNIINYEVDYQPNNPASYMIQSVVLYELIKKFEIGIGATLTANGGFNPIITLSFFHASKSIRLSIQPSYELHKQGNGEIFSFFEWHPLNNRSLHPYFRLQALTSFRESHQFSYHFWRLGVKYQIYHFGPALNVKHFGQNFRTEINVGVFFKVNI